jgi:hypothetical protein
LFGYGTVPSSVHIQRFCDTFSLPKKAKSRSASRELLEDVSVPLLGDEGPEAAVQLAARTLLNHLVNHLNHFPGTSGPASLSSQVRYVRDSVADTIFFYLGSDFFPSRIRIKKFKYFNPKIVSTISEI